MTTKEKGFTYCQPRRKTRKRSLGSMVGSVAGSLYITLMITCPIVACTQDLTDSELLRITGCLGGLGLLCGLGYCLSNLYNPNWKKETRRS